MPGLTMMTSSVNSFWGIASEPDWPGGKALGWYAEGRRFDSQLRLTFLFKNCDLWTLSHDFALHN